MITIKENYKNLLILNVLCILVIFINGWWRCKYNMGNDILMNIKLGGDLDGWSITHFLWFTILGYYFPHYFIECLIVGILWEFIEHYLGENRPSWLGGFGDCNLGTDQLNSSHKNWWFGRVSDVVMNIAGFCAGRYIRLQHF
jgi:hypothetical protein